jgi:hypothetical protein
LRKRTLEEEKFLGDRSCGRGGRGEGGGSGGNDRGSTEETVKME